MAVESYGRLCDDARGLLRGLRVCKTSLACTNEQSNAVEAVQRRRTCQIIIGGGKYRDSCTALNLDSLHVRRQQQCKTLFDKIVRNTEHCLLYLLPTERDPSVTGRRRSADNVSRIFATNRSKNSFICFGLLNFQ